MSSWEPLASTNPIPGDPQLVRALGDRLVVIADQVRDQKDRLMGVDGETFWEGLAADRFEAMHADLPPLLELVCDRYSTAGAAVRNYAPELEGAQWEAEQARRKAQEAQSMLDLAQRHIDQREEYDFNEAIRVRTAASAFPDRPRPQPIPWSGPNGYIEQAEAERLLEEASRMLRNAIQRDHRAGDEAVRAILEASHDRLQNTWHSRLATAAGLLVDYLPIEELAAIAGAVALIALFIPGGALVAGVAGLVALGLGALLWAADDFTRRRGTDLLISVALLGMSKGLAHLARRATTAAWRASMARRSASTASESQDLAARAARSRRRAAEWRAYRGDLEDAGHLRDLLRAPDELIETYDIYQSHPTLFTTMLPFGPLSGPVMAGILHHRERRHAGDSIAPIPPRLR